MRFRYDTSGQWLKGNTHIHSTASDGGKTFAEIADMYAPAGYDFLFRTDHWVPSDAAGDGETYPLLWLDGIELDGEDTEGAYFHVVCLGKVKGVAREAGLVQAMKEEYTKWAVGWEFSTLPYPGTSTATAEAPGVANATNTPILLDIAGSGPNPSQVQPRVAELLKDKEWRIDHEHCRLRLLLDAIDATIDQQFSLWLTFATFTLDTYGPKLSLQGTGYSEGTSNGTGKVI